MAELSMRTIAIVIIFLVVAGIALVFLFNVYSETTGQTDDYETYAEDVLEDGVTGRIVENIDRINEISNKLR